ncbi:MULTISPECIES: DUF481 domain-containing protein [Rheinheimera]|uniref:DUF481 domain-containing protein n=1 Tax=Rheinheimera TaxID=67575 RepID=UPI001053BEA6|nr:DUF481 domain-containing protein [Rheinheimera sp. D18]QBL09044.1 DUF481 domain-containing protein [Rheinheimera sp. D18]
MPVFLRAASLALLLCLFGAQAAEGDDLPSGEEPLQPIGFFGTVTGDIELGFLFTSGNTDSFAIRANSELVHDLEYFRNRYQMQSLLQKNNVARNANGDTQNVTTASRYSFTGQSNYKLVKGRESIFGRATYAHDKFGAFREQASLAVGYGNRVYEQRTSYFDLETGPGFSYSNTAASVTHSGVIWFVAANLDYALFDTSSFRQTLEGALSLDGENTIFLSRSSITTKIIDKLSMRFSFIVKYNSEPEGDLRKADTETSASLVYTF